MSKSIKVLFLVDGLYVLTQAAELLAAKNKHNVLAAWLILPSFILVNVIYILAITSRGFFWVRVTKAIALSVWILFWAYQFHQFMLNVD